MHVCVHFYLHCSIYLIFILAYTFFGEVFHRLFIDYLLFCDASDLVSNKDVVIS